MVRVPRQQAYHKGVPAPYGQIQDSACEAVLTRSVLADDTRFGIALKGALPACMSVILVKMAMCEAEPFPFS